VSTTDEFSIHITVGIRSPQVHHLVDNMKMDVIKELFFRKNLFDINQGLSPEVEKEFKEQLIQVINTISLKDLLESTKAQYIKDSFPSNHHRFLNDLISESRVNLNTTIIKKADYSYEASTENNFFVLKVNGEKEKFSSFMEPIIRHVLNSDKGVVVKELNGGRSDKSKIRLVKRLISKGIFEAVTMSDSNKSEHTNKLSLCED